jgi:nitrate/nitrite transporter NarK
LEIFPEMMGTATAVIGSTALFGTSFISIIISQTHNYEGPVLGFMFFLQAIVAAFTMTLVLLSRKEKANEVFLN